VVGFLAQSQSFRNFISSMGFSPTSAWHWGFAAAGVGMTLGLIQYVLGQKRLAHVGDRPALTRAAAEAVEPSGGVDYLTMVLALAGGAVGATFGMIYGEAGVLSALFPTVVGFFAGYLGGDLYSVCFFNTVLDDVRTSRLELNALC
jgi:POT family proton-dependent oligopeptide transporter